MATGQVFNPIGINVPAGGSAQFNWMGMPLFWNRVRECAGFTTTGGSLVATDANGWPTANQVKMTLFTQTNQSWEAGTYFCGFIDNSGTTSVATISGGGCTVGSLVPGAAGQYTTFQITAASGSFNVTISNLVGGMTNVFIYLPGYAGNTGVIDNVLSPSAYFTPSVNIYKNFGWTRQLFMSNNWYWTGAASAATRHTNLNVQTGGAWQGNNTANEGYPFEWGVGYANACNQDLWWPGAMNDPNSDNSGTYTSSYYYGIFQSALANLNGRLYLEFSNEIWNGSGGSNAEVQSLATAAGLSLYAYVGQKLHNIANIGRLVFGSQASFAAKVRIVLASSTRPNGGPLYYQQALNQLITAGGTPNLDLYCLSQAPYYQQSTFPSSTVTGVTFASAPSGGTSATLSPAWAGGTQNNWVTFSDGEARYCTLTNGNTGISWTGAIGTVTTAGSVGPTAAAINQDVLVNSPNTGAQYFSAALSGLARFYGLKLIAYESAGAYASSYGGYANYTASVEAAAAQPASQAYITGLLNSGYDGITEWGGVDTSLGTNNPGFSWDTSYANVIAGTSPREQADQSFTGGFTPTFNVISSGANIPGYQFFDNTNTTNPTANVAGRCGQYPSGHQIGYLVWSPTAQTLQVKLTCSASGTSNLEINGTTVATAVTVGTGATVLGSYAFPAGWSEVAVMTNASQSIQSTNLGFT